MEDCPVLVWRHSDSLAVDDMAQELHLRLEQVALLGGQLEVTGYKSIADGGQPR
jgi:hypothetical protein